MNKIAILMTAGTMVALPALAGTFASVTPPAGSVGTAAIGINDQGEVAGSYTTAGGEEIGFVGSIDGTYQTFSVDGNPTQARSVNNQGLVVGFYSPAGTLNEFARSKDGTLTTITKDGTPVIGIAQGVNASGTFVGDYLTSPPAVPLRAGYKGKDAAYVSDVTLPFATVRVAARGINAKGDISGWFIAAPGEAPQGFVIKSGETTVLNYPEANLGTFPQGINNKGEISGSWTDAAGISHGFVLDSDLVTWTSFDAPTGDNTQAWQINNLGQVAVTASSATTSDAYIYCPKKGGVCTGKNEQAASAKTTKGKSGLKKPATVGTGVDPDAQGKKVGHNN